MAAEFKALIQADEVEPEAPGDQMRSATTIMVTKQSTAPIKRLTSSRPWGTWQRTVLGDFVWDMFEEESSTWPQVKSQGLQNSIHMVMICL